MRFRRLDLIRYGKFTDCSIDLPGPNETGKPDFHLIVGPNEAGKSTIRHAISDLLFGIETRSRFDFLHVKSEMRLGALLENGDASLEFHRLKRNRQPLRRPDDTLLPDDALAPYTSNADRTSFEREFCLDHARLAAGGQNILDSKDDVGRMLFEASAGVGVFGDFLKQLEEEEKTLWSSRRSSDREFYKALDDFNDAIKAVKNATSRSAEWKTANRRVAEASKALATATDDHATQEQTRTRLDRVRRVAQHFQTRKAKIDERSALGDIIVLPENADEDLNAVKSEIMTTDRRLLEHQALIDKAVKDRDSVSVDEALLAHKDDILGLRDEKGHIKNHTRDLAKREAESLVLSKDIKALVRDLEWDMIDEESLDSALPSEVLREDIGILANTHGGLDQSATNTEENVTEKKRYIAVLTADLKALPDVLLPPGIKVSLNGARALGNTEETKADIKNHIKRAEGQFEDQSARMRPWTGSVQELRQLAVPGDAEVRKFNNEEHNIVTKQKNAQEQYEEIEDKLKTRELEESRLQESRNLVTPEDIKILRQSRNRLWANIRSGTKSADEAGDDYEARVIAVDDLTDDRYRNAEEAKELEHLRGEIARLKEKRARQKSKIEKFEDQRRKLMTDWGQITEKLSLGDMGISAFQTWLGYYRDAFSEAEKLTDEEAKLRDLDAREMTALASLRQVLVRANISEKAAAALTLRRLIDEVENLDLKAKETEATRRQLQEQLRQGRNDLEGLKDKAAKARQEMNAWNMSWSEKTKAARMPDKVSPQIAITALGLITRLKEKLKENRDLKQSRIETMQMDIKNFDRSAEALAQAIAPDLTGHPAADICSTLCQRLTVAENEQNTLEKALREIEENKNQLDKAQALKTGAKDSLAPHMERAKVDTIADLETAIENSKYLHLLNRFIEDATTTILNLGDGLSLDDLYAEVAEEDLSTIAIRLEDVKVQSAAAMARRDECLSQKKDAETERAKIHGQADAAMSEAQRQEALARMVEVTERFIKVHMGVRLLRWSIERYQDEKRGPLLDRASKIFSTITQGSFQTLEIDYDGDKPQLMGRRPDGKHVDFEGLSEGTGDQLFLSLRLAAVEMQLQHAQPLPFIADDLFIKYSDGRAVQGFKALGELATKSQVIYFTHHDHLIDVARGAIGEELNVTRL
jgi:uncharacterized protein YhaN